jgi:DHA1 family bicyclomycin/chloramphenicol resistance-like MFS transporter
MIFALLLSLALIVLIWFGMRQQETLTPEQRTPFSLRRIALAVGEVCRNRCTLGYTIAAGLVFGAFLGYLNSAQQIFQSQFDVGTRFPLYFAALALSLGCSSIVNARFVMRYGMRLLSWHALRALTIVSAGFFVFAWTMQGNPPLWTLMTWGPIAFFCLGLVFGNFNAMAMEPLGHIAGVGAAVIGSLATMISLLLGLVIGQSYDGTVLPLVGGFAILGLFSVAVMYVTERGVPKL